MVAVSQLTSLRAFPVSTKNGSGKEELSSLRLAVLTASVLGVQMFFSILMAYGNPYLSSLGFSPGFSSLVWLAGPMAGVLVNPVMGAWSDACVSKSNCILAKLGPRKPFILMGAFCTVTSLLILANLRDLLEILGVMANVPQEKIEIGLGEEGNGSSLLKMTAVFWAYAANIAVQPLQVGVRAYVIDCIPPEQQIDASAWISRWNSLGAVLAFWLGSLNLTTAFPWLGRSQFGVLAVINGLVLLTTIGLSFWSGSSVAAATVCSRRTPEPVGIKQVWIRLFMTWKTMPQISWIVCKIQFWSWMAWFPFLYYNTTYTTNLRASTLTHQWKNATDSFFSDEPSLRYDVAPDSQIHFHDKVEFTTQFGSFASFLFALTSLCFTLILPMALRKFPVINVAGLWFSAHLVFAIVTWATILVHEYTSGSILVACLGFSWAMTQWAPYALIGTEVSKLEEDFKNDTEVGRGNSIKDLGGAGAILGLHNVAISGPQVVAALESSILFGLLGMLQVHDDTGWVIRITGLAVFGALWSSKPFLSRH